MLRHVFNLEDRSIVLFYKDVLIFLLRKKIVTELSTDNLDICTHCQMAVSTFFRVVP